MTGQETSEIPRANWEQRQGLPRVRGPRGRMVPWSGHRLWGFAVYQLGELGNSPASQGLSVLNYKLKPKAPTS